MNKSILAIPIIAVVLIWLCYPARDSPASGQARLTSSGWEYAAIEKLQLYRYSSFNLPNLETDNSVYFYLYKGDLPFGPYETLQEAYTKLGGEGKVERTLDLLNQMGADNWELVSHTRSAVTFDLKDTYVFKRPKQSVD